MVYEQATYRPAGPNSLHALRGIEHAIDLQRRGREHQHGVEAVGGCGAACATYHFNNVVGLKSKRVQCDEIWCFCYSKQANVKEAKAAPYGAGDVWTWTAVDADSKLIVWWMV